MTLRRPPGGHRAARGSDASAGDQPWRVSRSSTSARCGPSRNQSSAPSSGGLGRRRRCEALIPLRRGGGRAKSCEPRAARAAAPRRPASGSQRDLPHGPHGAGCYGVLRASAARCAAALRLGAHHRRPAVRRRQEHSCSEVPARGARPRRSGPRVGSVRRGGVRLRQLRRPWPSDVKDAIKFCSSDEAKMLCR